MKNGPMNVFLLEIMKIEVGLIHVKFYTENLLVAELSSIKGSLKITYLNFKSEELLGALVSTGRAGFGKFVISHPLSDYELISKNNPGMEYIAGHVSLSKEQNETQESEDDLTRFNVTKGQYEIVGNNTFLADADAHEKKQTTKFPSLDDKTGNQNGERKTFDIETGHYEINGNDTFLPDAEYYERPEEERKKFEVMTGFYEILGNNTFIADPEHEMLLLKLDSGKKKEVTLGIKLSKDWNKTFTERVSFLPANESHALKGFLSDVNGTLLLSLDDSSQLIHMKEPIFGKIEPDDRSKVTAMTGWIVTLYSSNDRKILSMFMPSARCQLGRFIPKNLKLESMAGCIKSETHEDINFMAFFPEKLPRNFTPTLGSIVNVGFTESGLKTYISGILFPENSREEQGSGLFNIFHGDEDDGSTLIKGYLEAHNESFTFVPKDLNVTDSKTFGKMEAASIGSVIGYLVPISDHIGYVTRAEFVPETPDTEGIETIDSSLLQGGFTGTFKFRTDEEEIFLPLDYASLHSMETSGNPLLVPKEDEAKTSPVKDELLEVLGVDLNPATALRRK